MTNLIDTTAEAAYLNRITLTAMQIVDGDKAAKIARALRDDTHIAQVGIAYPTDGKSVIFTTTCGADLDCAMVKGYWDHTTMASRVVAGTQVFIITNTTESRTNGSRVIIATAVKAGEKLETGDTDWASLEGVNGKRGKVAGAAAHMADDAVVSEERQIAALYAQYVDAVVAKMRKELKDNLADVVAGRITIEELIAEMNA